MQPTQFEFVFLFLPLVVTCYWIVNKKYGTYSARLFLLGASSIYIAAFEISSVFLIWTLIIVNYLISNKLLKQPIDQDSRKYVRKVVFYSGTLINIFPLIYYKYFNYLVFWEQNSSEAIIQKVLPIGISFFTFVQIIHLWHCYSGPTTYRRFKFVEYAQVLTFFPHLVAGPIVTPGDLVPQLRDPARSRFDSNKFALGIFLISIGFFKKLVIADGLAENVQVAFDDGAIDGLRVWIGVLSYTFQLYFDFSGYVDIARGGSMLFGLYLHQNFNSPLKATNISDFWSRWHMSLTRIANQYIYTPVALFIRRKRWGGKRSGQSNIIQLAVPTLITFVLIGVWHGAGVKYLVFGVWHGAGVAAHSLWKTRNQRVPVFVGFPLTFLFVMIGFVFFRSEDMTDAFRILNSMFGWETIIGRDLKFYFVNLQGEIGELHRLGMVCVAALFTIFLPSSQKTEERFKPSISNLMISIMAVTVSLGFMYREIPFMYWQF